MKDFLKGFCYAFHGLAATIKRERNMRFHLVVAAYLLFFLVSFDFFVLTRTQVAILFVVCSLVIGFELLNTALEAGLDAVVKHYDRLVKLAKDACASAVLVAGIGAVGAGIAILYQPPAFHALWLYYKAHPLMLALLLLSIAASLWFIFGFGKKKEHGGAGNSKK